MKCRSPTGAQPLSPAGAGDDETTDASRPMAAGIRRAMEFSRSGRAASGCTLMVWCAGCQPGATGIPVGSWHRIVHPGVQLQTRRSVGPVRKPLYFGGEGEIRTHETREGLPVFKTDYLARLRHARIT